MSSFRWVQDKYFLRQIEKCSVFESTREKNWIQFWLIECMHLTFIFHSFLFHFPTHSVCFLSLTPTLVPFLFCVYRSENLHSIRRLIEIDYLQKKYIIRDIFICLASKWIRFFTPKLTITFDKFIVIGLLSPFGFARKSHKSRCQTTLGEYENTNRQYQFRT